MLQHALNYWKQGWNVIPVDKEKRPKVRWEQYQRRKVSKKDIERWWKEWPDANIGVITGSISRLVVIDIDEEQGIGHVEPFLNGETLKAVTGGGGIHLYFKHPGGRVPNAVRMFPGVDCRGDGGYVVVPPSIHKNGQAYIWDNEGVNVSELPEALLSQVQKSKKKLSTDDWSTELQKGKRDEELTRRAGKLLQIGIPAHEALSMLKAWNQQHCKPPLGEGPGDDPNQVEKIVMSIAKREEQKQQEQQTQEQEEYFRVYPFEETLEKYGFEEVTWSISEWVPEATCGLIVAPPANYKTWLLLDLAVSVATGKPFLNRYHVEKPGPVLLIQQEDPFPMLFSRIGTIMNIGEPTENKDEFLVPKAPPFPQIYWHIDRLLNFDDKKSVEGLQRAVDRIRPAMVIVDPLYSAISSKDYMAEGAQTMLALKRIRDDYGCSFMIAHHTVKRGDMDGRESLWGSQFLNAWLETGWQIRPTKDGESTIRIKRHFKNSAIPSILKLSFNITNWSFDIVAEETDKLTDDSKAVTEMFEEEQITDQREFAKKLDTAGLNNVSQIFRELKGD